MTEDKKMYNAMEPVLNSINRDYVSLDNGDIKRNNLILKGLLDVITPKMKEKDTLFKEMYSRVFYGGSFYDGLRVGQPDEFDLDLLLSLPKLVEPTLTTSNKPGFVHLQIKELIKLLKQPDLAARYKGLDKLTSESNNKVFLDTSKVLRWMEKVVSLALNDFPKQGAESILKTSQGDFYAKVSKGGPAFTLKVRGGSGGKSILLDIDLVPCFVFGKDKWPENGFRANPVKGKPDFFIVPKPLKEIPKSNHYWRLSFQEQERVLIDGKKTLKPTVKLLKKLRDTLDHRSIASYYLKTVILWQTERDEGFWNNSLSYVFITMLKQYYDYLNNGKIPYYWNKNNNLIQGVNKDTLTNMSNKIKLIISDIEKHKDNPLVVAKYLLKPAEFNNLSVQPAANGGDPVPANGGDPAPANGGDPAPANGGDPAPANCVLS